MYMYKIHVEKGVISFVKYFPLNTTDKANYFVNSIHTYTHTKKPNSTVVWLDLD